MGFEKHDESETAPVASVWTTSSCGLFCGVCTCICVAVPAMAVGAAFFAILSIVQVVLFLILGFLGIYGMYTRSRGMILGFAIVAFIFVALVIVNVILVNVQKNDKDGACDIAKDANQECDIYVTWVIVFAVIEIVICLAGGIGGLMLRGKYEESELA